MALPTSIRTQLKHVTSDLAFNGTYGLMLVRRTLQERRARQAASTETAGPGAPQEGADAEPLPPFGSTVTVDGIVMRIDERMSEFNIRKLMAGRHTQHERALIIPALRDDDVVLELGGGIGMVAIACAQRLGSDRVHSFEANPELEPLIRDNYALNGVSPHLSMGMVGPKADTRTFYLSDRFSRSSMYATEPEQRAVEVPVRPFNEEMARIRPTVLVIDIQGGERELMSYADFSGVRTLLVELHPFMIGWSAMRRVRRSLRAAGFVEEAREGQSFLYVNPHVARRSPDPA